MQISIDRQTNNLEQVLKIASSDPAEGCLIFIKFNGNNTLRLINREIRDIVNSSPVYPFRADRKSRPPFGGLEMFAVQRDIPYFSMSKGHQKLNFAIYPKVFEVQSDHQKRQLHLPMHGH